MAEKPFQLQLQLIDAQMERYKERLTQPLTLSAELLTTGQAMAKALHQRGVDFDLVHQWLTLLKRLQ
jgi:hypothetical protein